MNAMFDLLIKNGTVFDGLGSEGRKVDIAVKGDKIVKIEKFVSSSPVAGKVIDATGKIVSPGFIDMHSHSDFKLLADRRAGSKVRQGVTTEVGGNCGLSGAPLSEEMRKRLWGSYGKYGVTLDWLTFPEYRDKLEEGIGINFVPLLGHGNVRASVMGKSSLPAGKEEIKKMRTIVDNLFSEGVFGLSSGLIYPPGCFSDENELTELCKVAAGKRTGSIYATHMRGEGEHLLEAVTEALNIAGKSGIRLHISHLKAAGENNWHKLEQVIQKIEEAHEEGIKVTVDRYPYTASATDLDTILPLWVHEGGRKKELERLRDVKLRAEMAREINKFYPSLDKWRQVMISGISKNKQLEGKRMDEIISRQPDKPPAEVLMDLLLEEETEVGAIFFSMSEDNLKTVLTQPFSMLGSDSSLFIKDKLDGCIHPRTLGTFPRFLQKFVREDKVFNLSEALVKMTSFPAETLGLKNRGMLKEGCYADLVIFNFDTIADMADYAEPFAYPEGIDYTIVNGKVVFKEGSCTGEMSGKVIQE